MEINEDVSKKLIGKSGQIVMTLLQPYLGKSHTVLMDNWYNSPALFMTLHKNLTNTYGTVKKKK